ncbi:hypothetical protein PM082_013642 [Marasmius tenuissimus]|nr:hypothetical protein PM082_013642 [Marasmius tenuissimus]
MQLISVGDRVSYLGNSATVKSLGTVDGTDGTWLGVEWDDPSRGKHDGVKDGKRYFSCRFPNAGSFIRPSANVKRGVSFLEGLTSKYIEAFHGSTTQEKVTLGSSNGAIEVEAVNLDKVRGKFSNLSRLREVSLENELIARADPPGKIQETCPNIRGLDLSTSLLPTWGAIADIAAELASLQRLGLNRTRLTLLYEPARMSNAFLSLYELQLNGTLMTWPEFQEIVLYLPRLRTAEMGYNNLSDLSSQTSPQSSIESLNFDNNNLSDWSRLWDSLRSLTHLDRIVFAFNRITRIPPPGKDQIHSRLKHISLHSNRLESWGDIDALSAWFPSLLSLSIAGNPLVDITKDARYSRQFIIARIPTLTTLDAAAVSTKERTDSEIFYLSHISQYFNFESGSAALLQEHPRWDILCQRYGVPDRITKRVEHPERLSSRLFEILLYRVDGPVPDEQLTNDPISLRVLPTMTLKVFRLKVRKTLKVQPQGVMSLWVKMPDGKWIELTSDRDGQDLEWLGLEGNSQVACCVMGGS